jgi:hypothetical protein
MLLQFCKSVYNVVAARFAAWNRTMTEQLKLEMKSQISVLIDKAFNMECSCFRGDMGNPPEMCDECQALAEFNALLQWVNQTEHEFAKSDLCMVWPASMSSDHVKIWLRDYAEALPAHSLQQLDVYALFCYHTLPTIREALK